MTRLTTAQALIRFLAAQELERDGERGRFFAGCLGIFGHGNVAGIGQALHLLQDSFSSAHVERAGGTGRVRHIRVFFIRLGWPPLSRAPHEHNAPSDPRDDVYVGGALRPEALAAVLASTAFLRMALRHLRAPGAPGNAAELRAFMHRYLAM